MRERGLTHDQCIRFTLRSKVLEAFVVLQERPQVVRAGERLQAVPRYGGGRGQPRNGLFMDKSRLVSKNEAACAQRDQQSVQSEMWQNRAYFTLLHVTFHPPWVLLIILLLLLLLLNRISICTEAISDQYWIFFLHTHDNIKYTMFHNDRSNKLKIMKCS